MPYSLHVVLKNGSEEVIKPIAFDNPKSEFKFEDRKIERKLDTIIKKFKKFEDIADCYFKKY